MSLDLSSPNAKNRLTLIQKGLPNKFRGEVHNFQAFLYSFANFARNLSWTAENDGEFGVLDFVDPDSGEKIVLHVDPSKVTPEMITAAHQAHVQAVNDAEAAVVAAENADPPDEDEIKTTKLALAQARQALSSEAEIMMLLDLSCQGSAHQILVRYQSTIKGNGVMAFKILNTKCNPSPLWGLENARNEIARHSVASCNGNVLDYLQLVTSSIQRIQLHGGEDNESWLIAQIFKGLSASRDNEWLSAMAVLQSKHRDDPQTYDSDKIVAEADDLYRELLGKRGQSPIGNPAAHLALKPSVEDLRQKYNRRLNDVQRRSGRSQHQRQHNNRPNHFNRGSGRGKGGHPRNQPPPFNPADFPRGWSSIPPKPGEPNTKWRGTTKYTWCEPCGYWGKHAPGKSPHCKAAKQDNNNIRANVAETSHPAETSLAASYRGPTFISGFKAEADVRDLPAIDTELPTPRVRYFEDRKPSNTSDVIRRRFPNLTAKQADDLANADAATNFTELAYDDKDDRKAGKSIPPAFPPRPVIPADVQCHEKREQLSNLLTKLDVKRERLAEAERRRRDAQESSDDDSTSTGHLPPLESVNVDEATPAADATVPSSIVVPATGTAVSESTDSELFTKADEDDIATKAAAAFVAEAIGADIHKKADDDDSIFGPSLFETHEDASSDLTEPRCNIARHPFQSMDNSDDESALVDRLIAKQKDKVMDYDPAVQQALANSFDPYMQELAARRMMDEAFGDTPASNKRKANFTHVPPNRAIPGVSKPSSAKRFCASDPLYRHPKKVDANDMVRNVLSNLKVSCYLIYDGPHHLPSSDSPPNIDSTLSCDNFDNYGQTCSYVRGSDMEISDEEEREESTDIRVRNTFRDFRDNVSEISRTCACDQSSLMADSARQSCKSNGEIIPHAFMATANSNNQPFAADWSHSPNVISNTKDLFDSPTNEKTLKRYKQHVFLANSDGLFEDPALSPIEFIMDTGATLHVTSEKEDLYNFTPTSNSIPLNGIAKGLKILGYGFSLGRVIDATGTPRVLPLRQMALVEKVAGVPPLRIVSPQAITQSSEGVIKYEVEAETACLIFYNTDGEIEYKISTPYSTNSNLPILSVKLADYNAQRDLEMQINSLPIPTNNLSRKQEHLLEYHRRLGHRNMQEIQELARSERFGLPKDLANCPIPRCADCQLGSQGRRPVHKGSVVANKLQPGDSVHVDQMISPHIGIPFRGSALMGYKVMTVFVDAASSVTKVYFQTSTGGDETVASKVKFEAWCQSHNVQVKHYHADNGIFNKDAWRNHCTASKQSMSFCGVNAHHQNPLAENAIRRITNRARTAMMTIKLHWDMDKLDERERIKIEDYWPFACHTFAELDNEMPKGKGQIHSRISIFSKTAVTPHLTNFHAWGCPVYVLDPNLASGRSVPRWKPRSRLGLYLGPSPDHASNVALVLNLKTKNISPQYHCVFDDRFHTVDPNTKEITAMWEHLYTHNREQYADPSEYPDGVIPFSWEDNDSDSSDRSVPPTAPPSSEVTTSTTVVAPVITISDRPPTPPPIQVPVQASNQQTVIQPIAISPSNRPSHQNRTSLTLTDTAQNRPLATTTPPVRPAPQAPPGFRPRSTVPDAESQRERTSPAVITDDLNREATPSPTPADPPQPRRTYDTRSTRRPATPRRSSRTTKGRTSTRYEEEFANLAAVLANPPASLAEQFENIKLQTGSSHPMCLLAQQNADSPSLRQALLSEDAAEWEAALIKELENLEEIGTWEKVPKDKVPPTATILKSIWALKKKRLPSGKLLKYKARLCVRGDLQIKGENFWETYSPVVSWPLIRMMFILTAMFGLQSRHVDFTNAFAQSFLEEELYMELPDGFDAERNTHCLKLIRSLYGLRQSAMNWFQTIALTLQNHGLEQSKIDPCLFFGKGLIVVLYVDDVIIFHKDKKPIDELIKALADEFPLTDEGDVTAYLGVEVTRRDDGSMHLRQPSSIQKLLDLIGLDDTSNPSDTPAVVNPAPGKDGSPPSHKWSYPSAVGILLWLAFNTRPDIAFATSQAARYMSSPKQPHYNLVVRIARYLLGTKDKGMIIKPNLDDPSFKIYVDASFAGDFCRDNPEVETNPETVRSRSGHVLCYADVPLLWISKLQSEVALSTTEAEFIALSNSLRDIIPISTLLNEISAALKLTIPQPEVLCTVFEDNNGAIAIATTPKMRPRTKHLAIKYLHFLEHVQKGTIAIKHIATDIQLADQLTHPLAATKFRQLRKLLMGW